MDELNFLWTQWKNQYQIDKLPIKNEKPSFSQKQTENNTSYTDNVNSKVETSDFPKNENNYSVAPSLNIPLYSNKLYNKIEDNHHLSNK